MLVRTVPGAAFLESISWGCEIILSIEVSDERFANANVLRGLGYTVSFKLILRDLWLVRTACKADQFVKARISVLGALCRPKVLHEVFDVDIVSACAASLVVFVGGFKLAEKRHLIDAFIRSHGLLVSQQAFLRETILVALDWQFQVICWIRCPEFIRFNNLHS